LHLLKKNELKPWRVKSWCIPKPSARFVAKMEDVLSVYHRPYDPRRPQVCLDEIHKTLRSTPRGEIPLEPGKARREDYEYERHGHCALFLAVEPLAGFRRVWVHERRTLLDCADVLRDLVDVVYPDAERIVLVVDNLNIHHPACLYERFEPAEARRIAEKLEWHYTPEHASWLNIAECELSVLKRQCLRSRLPDMATVQRKVTAWQDRRNERQVTVDWRFTTEDARIKLRRLYPVVNVQESA
jgi:transposase